MYSLDRKDARGGWKAWSPHDKRYAVVFNASASALSDRIEVLEPESGRWTTVASSREEITGIVWRSDHELLYAKSEPTPRTDSNLWVVDLNPETGGPSDFPRRLTQWTNYSITQLSASADGSRLCFRTQDRRSDIYIGTLQLHGNRLDALHRLTLEEAYNGPTAWTPDGKAILFDSDRYGQARIYKQEIDKDTADLISSGPGTQQLARISPDGRWILYISIHDTAGRLNTRLMRIPLAGGAAQEVFAGQIDDLSCSHEARGACVLAESRGNASIVYLLDPIKGRGPKVLQTSVDAGSPAISWDGQHIAFVLPGAPRNRIRIVDLHGGTEGETTVSGAELLQTLDWSVDGTGFFSGDVRQETTRLLYVERNGASHILWTQPTTMFTVWGIPSPDGRYLATLKGNASANVWMVENP